MKLEEVLKLESWGEAEVSFLVRNKHLLDNKTKVKLGITEPKVEPEVEVESTVSKVKKALKKK